MKRRNFLAFLGAAVAAPKILAKEVVKENPDIRKYPLTPRDCFLPPLQPYDVVAIPSGERGMVISVCVTTRPHTYTIRPLYKNSDLGAGPGVDLVTTQRYPSVRQAYPG